MEAKLERLKFAVQLHLSQELVDDIMAAPEINLHTALDFISNEIAIEARFQIAGNQLEVIEAKYPSDWWQSVKDRWYPSWAKQRWPIKYRTLRLVARELYPKMALPDRADAILHLSREEWVY